MDNDDVRALTKGLIAAIALSMSAVLAAGALILLFQGEVYRPLVLIALMWLVKGD